MFSLNNFKQLIHWLKASGELTYEAERIETWEEFMTSLPKKKVEKLLVRASMIGHWFEEKSNNVIGTYTPNVNAFIRKNDKKNEVAGASTILYKKSRRISSEYDRC